MVGMGSNIRALAAAPARSQEEGYKGPDAYPAIWEFLKVGGSFKILGYVGIMP